MSDKVQKYDPLKMMDSVKDRIRAEFASLIPEEAWTSMIKTEVDTFFKRRIDPGYRQGTSYTPFEGLVKTLLEEEGRKRFKEFCNSPEYLDAWSTSGAVTMSEGIKKFLTENSGEVFANFLGGMMQQAFSNMKYNL